MLAKLQLPATEMRGIRRAGVLIESHDVQEAGKRISVVAQPILSRKIFDLRELLLVVGDDGVTKGQCLCSN